MLIELQMDKIKLVDTQLYAYLHLGGKYGSKIGEFN